MTFWTIIITLLGALGVWLTRHIIDLTKQDENEPIVCMVGYDCDDTLRGKYAEFFGIPVVRLGFIYYCLVTLFYFISLFTDLGQQAQFIMVLISGAAVFFSLYLSIVQLFVIKKWCSWCLASALLSFLIFAISFTQFSSTFVEYLYNYRDMLTWIYTAFSWIGALVTLWGAMRFIKFLNDFKINQQEYKRLFMLSQTAWFSLGMVLLSAIGLVITDQYREITGNSEFLVLGIILGVLVLYELVQNTIIGPGLIDIHFGDSPQYDDPTHDYQRKLAFASTFAGVASWIMLLVFSNLSWHEYEPVTLVIVYFGVVFLAVLLGLLFERKMYQKSLAAMQDRVQEVESQLDA